MSPTDPANRRRHPRARDPNVMATIVTPTGPATCSLQDLSSGGARLVTTLPLRVGEHVELRLETDDGGMRRLAVKATVIRTVPMDGQEVSVAVRFDSVPAPVHDALQGVVIRSNERHRTEGRKTVLVVYDDASVWPKFARDLNDLGLAAICAPTPLDAIRCLIDPNVTIQIALVAMGLGPPHGHDVLTYLVDERPEIRRVIVSGDRQDALDREVAAGRAHAQLSIPWTTARLLLALGARPNDDSPRR